jgi:hypothetical protein
VHKTKAEGYRSNKESGKDRVLKVIDLPPVSYELDH